MRLYEVMLGYLGLCGGYMGLYGVIWGLCGVIKGHCCSVFNTARLSFDLVQVRGFDLKV